LPGSGRPPGGQTGHKGSQRRRLPPEQITKRVDLFPPQCNHCGRKLPKTPDADPLIDQKVEVPEIRPEVTEYRQHHVRCDCGHITCASLPSGVSVGMCGPRLLAVIAILIGVYRVSRRRAQQFMSDVLGVDLSLGALSKCEERVSVSLAPVVEPAREHALDAPVKHVDATGWRLGAAPRTLWTIATELVTVFCISVDATKETVRAMLAAARGILVSDRASQFAFWAMEKRQICWAHLIRKFASFAERKGKAGQLGEKLLFWTEFIFARWHEFRDGTLSRAGLRQLLEGAREAVEELLEEGERLGVRGVSGACANMLVHRAALWTFVDVPGVEPTNNHAERELRAFVLWRKSSFGSQSERGCRFAERLMTVVHTLRKQQRPVLPFLVQACQAAVGDGAVPSLLPAT